MDALTRRIAAHAAALTFDDLSDDLVQHATQHLVDALACGLGGFRAEPALIGRALAMGSAPANYSGRLFGHRQHTAADLAAFVNTAMIRNLDFNDTYPGGHPSDCVGALLALAEASGADGRRFLSSLVVAYEVFVRLIRGGQLRERGWDQGIAVGIATSAGVGRLLQLQPESIGHAVSIAAVSNVSVRVTRTGELSLWKGAATAFAARNGVFAALLAAEGMSGPPRPFDGHHGVWAQVTGAFDVDPFPNEGGAFLLPMVRFKYWPAEYSAQAAVWAALELRNRVQPADLVRIRVGVHEAAWRDIGTGPEKWDPQTRETADHSLPYVLARTLVDGDLTVASFTDDAVLDPSLRPVMARVEVESDPAANAAWPAEVLLRLTATDLHGQQHDVEVRNPRGHERNAMTADETSTKFRSLGADLMEEARLTTALDSWWNLRDAPALGPLLDALVP